jgi:hypothetical protein
LEFPYEGHWNISRWAAYIKDWQQFQPDQQGRIKLPQKPGIGIVAFFSLSFFSFSPTNILCFHFLEI